MFSGLVAIMIVACMVPFTASDDSDALIGNTSGMSLNKSSAVIYTTGTSTVDLWIQTTPDGVSSSNAAWYLHDLDDGVSFVTLTNNNDGTYTVTAGTIPADHYVASVEVVASITVGNVTHTASAVIVVYPSASTSAIEFNYFIKIDSDAYDYLTDNELIETDSGEAILPENYTMSQFNTGFWITVKKSQTGLSNSEFNALSALQWYLTEHNWDNTIGSYGWIQDLLGLDTYSGSGGVWYYWAQYHLTNSGWVFNDTTLGFISDVGSSYIGLIFWGSPNSDTMPSPVPAYPVRS